MSPAGAMMPAPVSTPAAGADACDADAIRWRLLRYMQQLDVAAACREAGIDPRRLKDLLADERPSAELAALVARAARVPVAEIIFGPEARRIDGHIAVGAASPEPAADLLRQLAQRLEALQSRVERALLALAEVETKLSAAGVAPSELVPEELKPLYAKFLTEPAATPRQG